PTVNSRPAIYASTKTWRLSLGCLAQWPPPACGCGSTMPRYDLRVDDLERSPQGAMRVWLVALSVYLLAVFHRSSMAVAGIEAAHRFGISASALATFTMLQLLVYAGMQVPVGLILDRSVRVEYCWPAWPR